MKDMQARLETLRTDANDCALIGKLATERGKRELFARLAAHLSNLALDVEQHIKAHATEAAGTSEGRK
jgi:hypothetical protein